MREVKKSFASIHLEQKFIQPSVLETERDLDRGGLRTKRAALSEFNKPKLENVLRYGDPVQLNASFKYTEPTQNLKMAQAQDLGSLVSGSFIQGNVTIKPKAENSENFFTIMPAIELNSKLRVERQIERIKRYRAGKFSANRIDDSDEIKKNIDNLDRQLQAQINIA